MGSAPGSAAKKKRILLTEEDIEPVNKWWDILYQMNLADGALLNETAWSALVGMRKREARDAAKAELAAE